MPYETARDHFREHLGRKQGLAPKVATIRHFNLRHEATSAEVRGEDEFIFMTA
jgi:hypothetical protein